MYEYYNHASVAGHLGPYLLISNLPNDASYTIYATQAQLLNYSTKLQYPSYDR